jgi:hypothetical protein
MNKLKCCRLQLVSARTDRKTPALPRQRACSFQAAVSRTYSFALRPLLEGELSNLLVNANFTHDANHAGHVPSNIPGISCCETVVDLVRHLYHASAGIHVDLIWRPQVRMLSDRLLNLRCDPCIIH